MSSYNTILLRRDPGMQIEEAVGDGVVKPGHLVYLKSTGKVAVHAVEGGDDERAVATEDALQGRVITTAYADGELVSYAIVPRGNPVQMILKAGENVAIGDLLMSAGDGTLKEYTAPTVANAGETLTKALSGNVETITLTIAGQNDAPDIRTKLFKALEALDLSGQGAVDGFIKVRAL
jgi:hypothetical protein